jgi:hypothetical protein
VRLPGSENGFIFYAIWPSQKFVFGPLPVAVAFFQNKFHQTAIWRPRGPPKVPRIPRIKCFFLFGLAGAGEERPPIRGATGREGGSPMPKPTELRI